MITLPGSAVGAGLAVTFGAKDPTLTFSVGVTDGALVDEDGLVSAGFSFVEQAVTAPELRIADAPAISAIFRISPADHILFPRIVG